MDNMFENMVLRKMFGHWGGGGVGEKNGRARKK